MPWHLTYGLYEVGNTLARRLPEQAGLLLDVLVRFDLPPRPSFAQMA